MFDRYNFTVNEAEPLEKEVAIDPEMLGKVFENLIEENLRKGIGSYYTPRIVVHFICREVLLQYLRRQFDWPDWDKRLRGLFEATYADEPFIELADSPPGVRDVRDTNICRIHATVEPATGRTLVFAAIDNLWKGASGQAVQDLNLMLGLDETAGLV